MRDGSPCAEAHSAESPRAGRASVSWLRPAPIADPLDRRNAAMLRILLVCMGIAQPLSTLSSQLGPQPVMLDTGAVVLSAASTALVWLCFLILHRGHFRIAANLFVATSLLFLFYVYAEWGLAQQMRFQLGQVYPVLVGGLLLSRRSLWLCAGMLGAIFLVGAWRDLANLYYSLHMFTSGAVDLLRTLFALLVITLVLDRAVAALRDSLAVALKRGNDLARIRDRMQLEIEDKERSREQMLHAQKMQAVGRLASGIAHDFNHLLSLILGYARQGRDGGNADEMRQALAGVESAARRAAAVSHKLLNFAREDLTRTEVFDADKAVREMRPIFAQLFDPRTHLVYEPAGEALPISFDRAQFELMLLNIAANANQAMPDGGSFRVILRSLRESAQAEIVLADSGHGMSEDVLRRVFEPFFTTKPAGEGTGLGLPAAYNMVKANGGTLTAHSAPGAGAIFVIRLPLAAHIESTLPAD